MKSFKTKANSFLFVLICLGSMLNLAAAADSNNYCLKIYRKDLMQTWGIKNGSWICNIDMPSNYSIGAQAVNGALYLPTYGSNRTAEDHFWSNPGFKDCNYVISVYSRGNSGGQMICFGNTGSSSNVSYTWNDGLGAYKLYTYRATSSDIEISSGEYNRYINKLAIVGVLIASLVGAIFITPLKFNAYTTGIGDFALILTILEGSLDLSNSLVFILVLLVCLGLGALITFLVSKWSNYGFYFAMATYSILAIWFFSTGFQFFCYAVASVLILLIQLCFLCKVPPTESKPAASMKLLEIGAFLATHSLIIQYLFVTGPSLLYLFTVTGRRDYVNGTNIDGLLAFLVPLIALPFYLGIGCYLSTKRMSQEIQAAAANGNGDEVAVKYLI